MWFCSSQALKSLAVDGRRAVLEISSTVCLPTAAATEFNVVVVFCDAGGVSLRRFDTGNSGGSGVTVFRFLVEVLLVPLA